MIQGNRITSVSRRGQAPIPANAQVIRADGKFILPGLWDSQVSYNWYYGEVMLNYGITSTIDVGIAGEIGAPHRDGVHKGQDTRAASVHRPRPDSPPNRRRRHRARDAWHAGPDAEDGARRRASSCAPGSSWRRRHDSVRRRRPADGDLPGRLRRGAKARQADVHARVRAGPRTARSGDARHRRNLPHSAGIGRTVARTPVTSEDDPRNEADLYRRDGRGEGQGSDPAARQDTTSRSRRRSAPRIGGFQRDWDKLRAGGSPVLRDRGSGAARLLPARADRDRAGHLPRPARRHRRGARAADCRGIRNALRFHKMFADAGGHVVPGANTNPGARAGQQPDPRDADLSSRPASRRCRSSRAPRSGRPK